MELWNSEMMRLSKGTATEAQPFRRSLAFSSTMEGVCSAQLQAQNKHSREAKGVREK
jgi:hypothetical protein